MLTVWKFPIPQPGQGALVMPAGARPLCVSLQDGREMLWALVDDTLAAEPHDVLVCETGQGLPDRVLSMSYAGTLHATRLGHPYVLHVFVDARPAAGGAT